MLTLGLPTERIVGEADYLSTLVDNVGCLMDVQGDGHIAHQQRYQWDLNSHR